MPTGEVTWGVLLQGLIGSVLTGAIAGLAVWWTVRHERRLAGEVKLQEAVTRLFAAGGILEAKIAATSDESDLQEWRAAVKVLPELYTWRATCREVWSRAKGTYPDFSKTVNATQLWVAYEITADTPAMPTTFWFRRGLLWVMQSFDNEVARFLENPARYRSDVQSREAVGEIALTFVRARAQGGYPGEWDVTED